METASVPSARRGPATHEDEHPWSANAARLALRRVLSDGGPKIVYQPQLSLSRMTVEGYEALARFPGSPIRGTEDWFSRARELGLGTALESAAVASALARRHERPAGTTIAVNVSPTVLTSPSFVAVLPADLTGIEIELTEHEWSPGTDVLRRRLDQLRERGARVAIDDVGTAHSGLRRVMDLVPDKLKLDRALVQGVADNPSKAALIRAVVDLAEQIGATVCAEGVENLDDLEAVAALDVASAQGWAVGLPQPEFRAAEPDAVRSAHDCLVVLMSGRPTHPGRAARPGRAAHPGPLPHPRPTSPTAPPSHLASPSHIATPSQLAPPVRPGPPSHPVPTTFGPRPPILGGECVQNLTDINLADINLTDIDEFLVRLTSVTSLPGLRALVTGCGRVLGADSLEISVLTDGDSALVAAGHRTGPVPTGDSTPTYPLARYPLTQLCLNTRSVVPVHRGHDPFGHSPPGEQTERDLLRHLHFETVLMVPVISRDRVIGLLECYRRDDAPWSRRQIRGARTIAAMLGPVLDGLLS
ncbi:EAL domain-containing protein [Kineosporia sp. NBRC 101731]|uniref:EAL domain-containing protein n=1 Tax=Kineosporia sp. NBRC 101731 TaxID=3032199 RepID=UPI0024A155CA|nr:EAL domain-containing protein [Kineosporia sp. NBRC 101731]GLY30216.1 hypothetical protein Kisp02_35810 [Kineosporia sp. NBRC 101731]